MDEPEKWCGIQAATDRLGFTMASLAKTGSLLRTLAATRPGGRFLELGTGTGLATAWLLDGMDKTSTLVTVDNDETVLSVAREFLGADPRFTILALDAGEYITTLAGQTFDFIFADTWAGKYTHLEEVLACLRPGGLYVVDDLLPQVNWPEGHEASVSRLIEELDRHEWLYNTFLKWSTGILIAVRRVG